MIGRNPADDLAGTTGLCLLCPGHGCPVPPTVRRSLIESGNCRLPDSSQPAGPDVADDHREQVGEADAGDDEGFVAAQPDGSCCPGGDPADGDDER